LDRVHDQIAATLENLPAPAAAVEGGAGLGRVA